MRSLDRSLTVAVGGLFAITCLLACAKTGDAASQETLMAAGLDALYSRHDPITAVAQFRKVLEHNPVHYGATFQLASALDQAGDADQARSVWVRVLAMADGYNDRKTADEAWARLAKPDALTEAAMQAGLDALYSSHDPARAAALFRQVLKRTPTHYGATYQLAAALDAAGRPEEARPWWQRMLAMADRSADKATAEVARARLDKPEAASEEVMMQAGLDARYRYHDANAAVAAFEKVLQQNPAHYGATYQLAAALDAAGRADQARPRWEKVLQMAEGYRDKETADTARARIAGTP